MPRRTTEPHGHQPTLLLQPVHNSPMSHHNFSPQPLKTFSLRYASAISSQELRQCDARCKQHRERPRGSMLWIQSFPPRARPVVVKTTRFMVPVFTHGLSVAFLTPGWSLQLAAWRPGRHADQPETSSIFRSSATCHMVERDLLRNPQPLPPPAPSVRIKSKRGQTRDAE